MLTPVGRRWIKDLEFDLGGALLDRVPNQRYFQAEMQLDVTVDQQGVMCVLLTGRTKDFTGRTGAPGTILDSHLEYFGNPTE